MQDVTRPVLAFLRPPKEASLQIIANLGVLASVVGTLSQFLPLSPYGLSLWGPVIFSVCPFLAPAPV